MHASIQAADLCPSNQHTYDTRTHTHAHVTQPPPSQQRAPQPTVVFREEEQEAWSLVDLRLKNSSSKQW